MGKYVFEVCEYLALTLICSATGASKSLETFTVVFVTIVHAAKNNGADQHVRMSRLICNIVDRVQNSVCLRTRHTRVL